MKLVLDTNVFISGIFWEGNFCSKIIDKWKNKKIELISSIEIIEELIETLRNFKLKMPEEIIQGWKTMIIENSIIVEPTTKLNVVKDDPDDNKFIETALAGKANFILSQDKHLLKLKKYKTIIILSPKEFLDSINF